MSICHYFLGICRRNGDTETWRDVAHPNITRCTEHFTNLSKSKSCKSFLVIYHKRQIFYLNYYCYYFFKMLSRFELGTDGGGPRSGTLFPPFPPMQLLHSSYIVEAKTCFERCDGCQRPELTLQILWAACQGPLSLPSPSSWADCVMDNRQHQEGTTLHHQYTDKGMFDFKFIYAYHTTVCFAL